MDQFLFFHYPSCSTCKKAEKFLKDNHISYTPIHIVENPPSSPQLLQWISSRNLPFSSFFNTRGTLYRSMELSSKLSSLSLTDATSLLSSHGMLIKRPLLVSNHHLFLGFRPLEWAVLAKEE